jgi:uncharacterized protein
MLKRTIEPLVQKHLQENKLLVLVGPKGNQRTELILKLSDEANCYVIDVTKTKTRKEIESSSFETLIEKMAGKKHLVIHEGQLLENLQALIEFVLFERDDVSLSCSCSFLPYLQAELIEALEIQGLILTHHSPTFQELAASYGLPQLEKTIDERLIFGNMEEVIQHPESAVTYLNQQLTSILETQISTQDRINKKDKLLKLLQYISFNIGEHLSYNEIGDKCGLDNETVERYIDLLEKSFVLVKIPVFYNEQKYELKKAHCFYFYDTGIRNACINNFNSLDMRFDANQLWKNWLIVEKIKNEVQTTEASQFYFWKTHTRQQVDFMQLNSTIQKAFQFQWNKKEKCKFPTSFVTYYPTIKTSVINKSTYWSFLVK